MRKLASFSLLLALLLPALATAADVSLVMGSGNQAADVALRFLGNEGRGHLVRGYSSQAQDVLVTLLANQDGAYLLEGYSTDTEKVLYTWLKDGSSAFLLQGHSTQADKVLFTVLTRGNTTYLLRGYSSATDQVLFTAVRSGSYTWLLEGYSNQQADVRHTLRREGDRTYLLTGYDSHIPGVHHTVVHSSGRSWLLEGYSTQLQDVVANYLGRGLTPMAALALDRATREQAALASPERRLALAVAAFPYEGTGVGEDRTTGRRFELEVLALPALANWQEATPPGSGGELPPRAVRAGWVRDLPPPGGAPDEASWPVATQFRTLAP